MQNISAKEYLKSIRTLDMAIKVKEEELYRLKLNIASLSPQTTGERVMNSSTSDMMSTVDKIVDMQAVINAEIDRLVNLKEEARSKINQLKDTRYVSLLTDYYINCKTWEQVADDMGYDLRYIYKLHGRALQVFDKILKEDIKRHPERCYNGIVEKRQKG